MHIRHAQPSDSSSLSRICLLTGNAGQSAESQHTIPEMPGLMYAVPYVHMPHTAGFVLVSPEKEGEDEEKVLGYVLFSYDTKKFKEAMEEEWFPPLREKYPLSMAESTGGEGSGLTSQDKHYIRIFHNPEQISDACVKFSPAHLVSLLSLSQHEQRGRLRAV